MRSFLPKIFRPNRAAQISAPVSESFQIDRAFLYVLQEAARRNLASLLRDGAPVAMAADAFDAVFGQTAETDPLAGYGLADWREGQLPHNAFVQQLIENPSRIAAIATPQSGVGADTLLPQLLRVALGEGALRHQLATACGDFLSERVLFYPGPPPQPLFSVAGLALLITSHSSQLDNLSAQGQQRLRAAVSALYGPADPLMPWDQWLLRRMADSAEWSVPESLTTLRWVSWQSGDPIPDPTEARTVPLGWLNFLVLEP